MKWSYACRNARKVKVALFTRAWIEMYSGRQRYHGIMVALFMRAWIEISIKIIVLSAQTKSPSSRGRGLKLPCLQLQKFLSEVALFTRAWIEIFAERRNLACALVALFKRAWIEMLRLLYHFWGSCCCLL